jgi:p-hydroxybenzoate 3-monooxygenase
LGISVALCSLDSSQNSDRAYIELQQRDSVVDARAVRMFEQWELAD